MDALPEYAELHALSNFSFLRGASHARELVERAHELGYRALALTDECSVAGVVRAHVAAKKLNLKFIVGAEFTLACGLKLVVLAATRRGYGQLCQLITRGRRAAPKGSYHLARADLAECIPPSSDGPDCLILWCPGEALLDCAAACLEEGRWLAERYASAMWLGIALLRNGRDASLLAACLSMAEQLSIRCVARGDVHMHELARRPLQDAITAIRHRVTIMEAGRRLFPNGERHLRARAELARLYPPALLAETALIAARCCFSLDALHYEYPREIVPPDETATSWLRKLVEKGALERWPQGAPPRERGLIEKELEAIQVLGYEPFFLTVRDIVEFARQQHILYQGRGSAANSIVCYCLKVTAVGPDQLQMLFERFLSKERHEPPDIDVDFEHERREEVIQYIYAKYGRERAALAATVITYGARSAVRDLIRVLDIDANIARTMNRAMRGWRGHSLGTVHWREDGVDTDAPGVARLLQLAALLVSFPRHLSQHVGGFVISEGPLAELVPVENATMADRTVIQWDKDDLEDLRLLKVDVLGLGMLSAIRKCFRMVEEFHGIAPLAIDRIPQDDAGVYDMVGRADTIGVFQIESRAQMSMLPYLRPRNYYDLVVEVSIVRPGPIQGGMVKPYLENREKARKGIPIHYPYPKLRPVLKRTHGVPIFQEQVMQLSIVAAGFTAGEADQLRRSMANWERRGGIEQYEEKLLKGMIGNGYDEQFAVQIVRQIRGFSDYGFPEAHAASFALLAYVSAWLKLHHPAALTAALLNSQPMGFYQPAQLLGDLRAHQQTVLPVDVRVSEVDCTLERVGEEGRPALRLGLRCVHSLSAVACERIVAARCAAPFDSFRDLGDRAALARGDMEALAAAGALAGFDEHRHLAFWRVAGYLKPLPTAPDAARETSLPLLRTPTEAEDIFADYRALGFTLGRHPLALMRAQLAAGRVLAAEQLDEVTHGAKVRVAGLVTARQRPMTSKGVTFVTLEDESGQVNIVVWARLGERQNDVLVNSKLMEVRGELQRKSGVTHIIASDLKDRTALIGALCFGVHEFH
ncbi:MAG: error-prone DNA polymerase [Pseudomonadota bacterium]